jgi:glycosyltransferase involved in cell wall biosynthesis
MLCAHPVQYSSPLFRLLAKHPQLDFQVAYCSLRGAEAGHDPEFGTTVQWDVPLLDGYKWTHLPNRGSGSEGFFGLLNPGVWKLIREGKFDAIFCPTGYIRATFWIARVAAWLSGSAFLFGTDAVALAARDAARWKPVVKRAFWPWLYRLASQVVVPSTASKEMMLSLGIPASRITVTPFVVDNPWWTAQAARLDRASLRRSRDIPQDAFVVLFCGKLQPWKRPQDVLAAFAAANLPDAILLIAGDGPDAEALKAQAQKLGCGVKAKFLGFANQSELPAIYTMSDLMILPSEYEPFGLVVNEAMLCGCAVAVSDRVGAGRDLVLPVDPRCVFPAGDTDALAALLRAFNAEPARLARFRERAAERMVTWSPQQNIAATVEAVDCAVRRLSRARV